MRFTFPNSARLTSSETSSTIKRTAKSELPSRKLSLGRMTTEGVHTSEPDNPGGSPQSLSLDGAFRRDALLKTITKICRALSALPPGQSLNIVANEVCKLLDVATCVIWENDPTERHLRVSAASSGLDDEYKRLTLSVTDERLHLRLGGHECKYIADVTQDDTYIGTDYARDRGWVSLLTVPIYINHEFQGMVDVYSSVPRRYSDWEHDALELIAHETALALHGVEKKVEELNRIVQELTEARTEAELFATTLRRALELVGCQRGWISKLDPASGALHIVAVEGQPVYFPTLALGEGITGKSLKDGRAIRVDDASVVNDYKAFWPDTRSELAIPIVMDNVEVHEGTEIQRGSKRLGVLNVESPHIGAFFNLDEDRLNTLVKQAALVYDRIETDEKFASLSKIEARVARGIKLDIAEIVNTITETLGFEVVNISLIDKARKQLKCRHVTGLKLGQESSFKTAASYDLARDGKRIELHVINTRQIEAISYDDPRVAPDIFAQFGHGELVRIFIPMISHVNNEVVGLVEAGYSKSIRPYIYERDVRLLKDFIDFVSAAIQQHRDGLIEKILHDLRAPAASLLSDAEFLSRTYKTLPDYRIQNKLSDMTLDTDLLFMQVTELERFFGGPRYKPTPERTVVYRDVVIKCLNQLRGMLDSYGFDTKKVKYDPADAGKIVLKLDPALLNNVVLNLLMNSVKYAEDDPSKFSLHVELAEDNHAFTIKFKDWGIGIKPEYALKIFEEGFRTPQARAKAVTGSGFGLSIAREHMLEIGGDLKLANVFKPTEFHVILPKKLKVP